MRYQHKRLGLFPQFPISWQAQVWTTLPQSLVPYNYKVVNKIYKWRKKRRVYTLEEIEQREQERQCSEGPAGCPSIERGLRSQTGLMWGLLCSNILSNTIVCFPTCNNIGILYVRWSITLFVFAFYLCNVLFVLLYLLLAWGLLDEYLYSSLYQVG